MPRPTDLRTLIEAVAAGRLTRRAFVQRATALGLSASLAGALARGAGRIPRRTYARASTPFEGTPDLATLE